MKKFLLLILAFQFYSLPGIAQWSGDPSVADTKVIVNNFQQRDPYIVSDGNGGSIVFWIDEGNSSAYNIYYNRLNSSGVAVWASTSTGLAMTNTSNYNDINQVISDGNGGAFIIYDNGGQILVQHIDNTGAKVWADNYIITSGENGFLCSDGQEGIIITWSNYDIDDTYQTYAQRLDGDGNTAWYESGYDAIPVIISSGSRWPMGIVTDGAGGAIISMADARNSNYDGGADSYDNMDIFSQRIDLYGKRLWDDEGKAVCTATRNQYRYGDAGSYVDYESYGQGQQHPTIISDGIGGAIIAWEDYRDDANNGQTELDNEGDIYCQRMDADGVAQWNANGIILCDQNGDQFAVSMMPDGNEGAVVAWVDRRSGIPFLYAQNVDGSGNPQWNDNGILVSNEIDWVYYTISSNPSNSAMLITWVNRDNFDYLLRAQKLNVSDGSLAWGANGNVVCSRNDGQTHPVITHAGSSGAIVAWRDERNKGTTNLDIYADLVVDGALPVTLITFGGQLKNNDVLLQWKTSSEQKAGHFEIEHSLDGTYFSKKGNVAASGNTSGNNYAFTDINVAKGANFYRLKIVDTDGRFKYSKTIKIITAGRNILQIFPNPTTNVLNLQITGSYKDGVIMIFDLSGKKVKEQRIFTVGNSTKSIDISQLPKGIYNLKFVNEKNITQLKFVKQ